MTDGDSIMAECDNFVIEDSRGNKKLLITDTKVILGSGDVTHPGKQ